LEGLEISIVNYSYAKSNDVFRFDSSYFLKNFLAEESIIRAKKHKKLIDIGVDLRSFGAYSLNNEVEYREIGIPFIRGVNMKNGRISFNDMTFIDERAHSLLWKSEVKPETVLLSMSGTIGDVAIASKKWEYPINSNQDIAKIETNWKINPYFLYAFLLSKFGQNYLKREARGSVQQHVFLSQMEQFEIPLLNSEFVKKLQSIIEKSDDILATSQDSYKSAETLLLETLGLSDFEPSAEPVNVKGFKESFLSTGRLDAEYYQKKYDNLEKVICSSNYKRIREIRTVNYRGMQPEYVENGSLDVINSKHILEDTLDYNGFEKTSDEYWDTQERARVFKGDILTYTTGANIGRTQVYRLDKKALASNHVNILRVKDEKPFYIGFVLNSMVGRMQTEKNCAGSAQVELYPKDLDEFIIPIIDKTIQNQIIELTEESFHLKKQSERLLETAKRAVEIAIEQNEDAALRYIEEAQRALI
jgi:restriction endonuclease S subunit